MLMTENSLFKKKTYTVKSMDKLTEVLQSMAKNHGKLDAEALGLKTVQTTPAQVASAQNTNSSAAMLHTLEYNAAARNNIKVIKLN
jgi:hypothetical protein